MEREHGFEGELRGQQLSLRLLAGLSLLVLVLGQLIDGRIDPWAIVCFGSFALLFALALRHGRNMMNQSVVVVHTEGLRYKHLPETEIVPWTTIRSARERQLHQRLELLDVEGRVCFRLEYQLDGFSQLYQLVLDRVALALPRPVRFRRPLAWDVVLLTLALLMVLGLAFVSLWLAGAMILLVALLFFFDEVRNPYAVEVGQDELVLTFPFRTVRIPFKELQAHWKVRHQQSTRIFQLSVEDPETKRTVVIRNVGADTIVLMATVQEAMREAMEAPDTLSSHPSTI